MLVATPPAPLPKSGGWLATRDRLLSSARFQQWAIAFPLTRWVARRRARALFDLCAGFVYSQVLYACVSLRLFDHLAEGPQSLDVLARRMGLTDDAALRLLDAARALDLVGLRGPGRYGLGSLGAALRGNPGVTAMIEHHALLYADLSDPVGLLRGAHGPRRLAAYWPYAGAGEAGVLSDADVSPYTALMSRSQAMIAAEVLAAYPLHRHRCLLDVGGGDGTFLTLAAARAPDLRLMLFDLPAVAERATQRFAREGLSGRATAQGGDFRTDSLPPGADVASLVRVIHDHDDATVASILRAVRNVLPPDGTLVLAEPMAGVGQADPVGDCYFGFYLLAMGRGRARTPEALSLLLRSAGFSRIRQVATRTPMLTQVIVARP